MECSARRICRASARALERCPTVPRREFGSCVKRGTSRVWFRQRLAVEQCAGVPRFCATSALRKGALGLCRNVGRCAVRGRTEAPPSVGSRSPESTIATAACFGPGSLAGPRADTTALEVLGDVRAREKARGGFPQSIAAAETPAPPGKLTCAANRWAKPARVWRDVAKRGGRMRGGGFEPPRVLPH